MEAVNVLLLERLSVLVQETEDDKEDEGVGVLEVVAVRNAECEKGPFQLEIPPEKKGIQCCLQSCFSLQIVRRKKIAN